MIKKTGLVAIFSLMLMNGIAVAQCMMTEITLKERIHASEVIAEGKVLDQSSFWNKAHTYIYTSNTIEIYKYFKGEVLASQVELITEGGRVGYDMILVNPALELHQGDAGIFFMHMSTVETRGKVGGDNCYETYAGAQGFVRYNTANFSASDVFVKYADLKTEIYGAIIHETGLAYSVIKPVDFIQENRMNNHPGSEAGPVISSFSPSVITAGTKSILTITGSGFGTTQGTNTVSFTSPDAASAYHVISTAAYYVSWSDTQIQIFVPSSSGAVAGTGTIQVTTGSGTTTSSGVLTVSYANTEIASPPANAQHISKNKNGGYNWQMNTAFDANAAAKGAFTRAFNTWRCNTYINWQLGATTAINTIAKDGINVIRFGTAGELPAGVIGRGTSYYNSCNGTTWSIPEIDIVFDSGTNWNFSTSAPTISQADFESVAVHELGHTHQLSHIVEVLPVIEVMNWVIPMGTHRRNLSVNDLACGNRVMGFNVIKDVCNDTVMTPLTPGNCSMAGPYPDFTATPIKGCVPQTVVFTDKSQGSPTTWSWSASPATGVTFNPGSSAQSPSATFTVAGAYDITLTTTNANGANTNTQFAYLTVNATPVQPTVSSTGATLISSSASGNQWYFNGVLIPGATSQNYITTQNGNYTVVVTTNGCSSVPSATFSMTTTGISEMDGGALLGIYPNPATNQMIQFSITSAANTNYQILVYNAVGQIIYSEMLEKFTGNYSGKIDISKYGSGVYLFSLNTTKSHTVRKVVVY